LRLRGWRDCDVEELVRMNADPRVSEFLPRRYTRDLSESQAATMRANLAQHGYGWWVVEVRGVTPFAGLIVLQEVPFEAPFTPAREVGWRFAHEHWGHGYATEGARAALEFGFATLGWNEIVAFTAASNQRSRRVMERLRMTYDPRDDFDHPRLGAGDPLRRHVLYRIKPASARRT
jgi:RimJ/RimL family protein N-acetyltransferase